MERKEAFELGLTKYNTGRACRYGHYADRYTESGACSVCLNGIKTDAKERRAAINDGCQEIKLFVYDGDLELLRASVDAICEYRFPGVAAEAFRLDKWKIGYVADGVLHIRVLVPLPDVDTVYALGKSLMAIRERPVVVPVAEVEITKDGRQIPKIPNS